MKAGMIRSVAIQLTAKTYKLTKRTLILDQEP